MQDDRDNLPSASGIERLYLCPGSRALEQTVPPEPESKDAASGTRIHAALAEFANRNREPEPGTLEEREIETFEMCAGMYDDLVFRWINPNAPTPPTMQKTEQREWLLNDELNQVFSGQYDVLILDGTRALCLDYKTGHGDQTESIGNLQLRALAVLVAENYNVTEVTVAIIQPWVSMTPQLCTYDLAALTQARTEVLNILFRSEDPNAPRVPGEKQCKFCGARAICPEANATVATLAILRTQQIEPVDLLKMLEVVGPAKKVIEALEARAKYLLEADPTSLPGWTLEEGASRRSIRDPRAAFSQLSNAVSAEEFAGCCAVKISELEKRFTTNMRTRTGLKAGECRNQFEQLLRGIIERKVSASSLARARPALEQSV